jgi:hypothetical protein
MTTTKRSAPRVRRHRQQLRDPGSVRLEVSLGADDEALAVRQGLPVRHIVQEALTAHVSGNREREL